MNRSADPMWAKVRDQLDRWFAEYVALAPGQKALDLQRRFRHRDPAQHFPAWWELYLFWLIRRSHPDKALRVEEDVASATRRPDFRVVSEDESATECVVEAVAPFTGIVVTGERHSGREAVLLDAIDELTSRDFFLFVEFGRVGVEQPRKRDVQEKVRAWLAGLDRVIVASDYAGSGELPRLDLAVRGWEIALRAWPKSEPRAGDRLIGIGPPSAGFVNDVAKIRGALFDKARRYDVAGSPFVIAVMPTSPPGDLRTGAESLYGSEAVRIDLDRDETTPVRQADGFFLKGAREVSAVLLGPGIHPSTAGDVWPWLWLNPRAVDPVPPAVLPDVPRVRVGEDDRLVWDEPDEAPARLLEL